MGKIVHLMRGLPSSGKSHTARRLAGDSGLVLETDEFFEGPAGPLGRDDPDDDRIDEARRWSFERFAEGVKADEPLIIVDRGNSLNLESHVYARLAAGNGYTVKLTEPDSSWWQEIRVLLKYKNATWHILLDWAEQLERISLSTHHVAMDEIVGYMANWRCDITAEMILDYRPEDPSTEDPLFLGYLSLLDEPREPSPP